MSESGINELKDLYVAINELYAKLGFEGEIDTRDPLVDKLGAALYNIDDGEYLQGFKLDAKFSAILQKEKEDENQLQLFMNDQSINSAIDKSD